MPIQRLRKLMLNLFMSLFNSRMVLYLLFAIVNDQADLCSPIHSYSQLLLRSVKE